MNAKISFYITVVVTMLILLSGCGDKKAIPPQDEMNSELEPVELLLLQDRSDLQTEEIVKWIIEPVEKKFPHIKLVIDRNNDGLAGLQQKILKEEYPDLIITNQNQLLEHRNLQSALDLTSWLPRLDVDVNQFDPTAIALVQSYSGDESLMALPFSLNFSALFYNEEIFDKSRHNYPTDGMTWEEVLELSKLSFSTEEDQFTGLYVSGIPELASQMSLNYVNPKTGNAQLHTDSWIQLIQHFNYIHSISTNLRTTPSTFVEHRTTAMSTGYSNLISFIEETRGKGLEMNWDMVQYPSLPENPNTSLGLTGQFMVVSSISQYKSDAVRVLSAVTELENQLMMNRAGRLSALNDSVVKKEYGMDNPFLQNKNISGVFLSSAAWPYDPSQYDVFLVEPLLEAGREIINAQEDINTIFRKAEEKANNIIKTMNSGF